MNQPSSLRHSKQHRRKQIEMLDRCNEVLVFTGPAEVIVQTAEESKWFAQKVEWTTADYGRKAEMRIVLQAGGVIFRKRCADRGLRLVSARRMVRR